MAGGAPGCCPALLDPWASGLPPAYLTLIRTGSGHANIRMGKLKQHLGQGMAEAGRSGRGGPAATEPEELLLPRAAAEADHREILARPPQAQHLGAARARA